MQRNKGGVKSKRNNKRTKKVKENSNVSSGSKHVCNEPDAGEVETIIIDDEPALPEASENANANALALESQISPETIVSSSVMQLQDEIQTMIDLFGFEPGEMEVDESCIKVDEEEIAEMPDECALNQAIVLDYAEAVEVKAEPAANITDVEVDDNKTLKELCESNAKYAEWMEKENVTAEDIKVLEEWKHLPPVELLNLADDALKEGVDLLPDLSIILNASARSNIQKNIKPKGKPRRGRSAKK